MAVPTPCPGCGALLDPRATVVRRSTLVASDACLVVANDVLVHELEHLIELGDLHQLRIDTYAAQHAGPETRPITTFFALSGLHLHLEHGCDNEDVRNAHSLMARATREYPVFLRPPRVGSRTVVDVARARSSEHWRAALRGWAADVWAAWPEDVRSTVRDRTRELLPDRWWREKRDPGRR